MNITPLEKQTQIISHYNFSRIHKTLRCTPAMEAGITDHVWELDELLTANSEARAA